MLFESVLQSEMAIEGEEIRCDLMLFESVLQFKATPHASAESCDLMLFESVLQLHGEIVTCPCVVI